MFVKKYDYKALDRTTSNDGTRLYQTPDGRSVPSVTTILSQTGDKSGLIAWRERIGEAKADRIRTEAAGLGTLMHTHLEAYITDTPRPAGKNHIRIMASNMANVIIECGLKSVKEVWGMEVPLYFPELFAGTADLIGLHDRGPAIIDYKTTSKMKTVDHTHDYALQTAAYALSHNEIYGTNIQTSVIFMVTRELDFKEFVITGAQWQKACEAWHARVEEYYSKF
jgi:hypothetical protein